MMLLAVLGKVSCGRLVWGAGCVYAYVCFFSFSYLRGWQYTLEISQPKPWAPLSSGAQSGTVNTPYFSWNLVPIPALGWDPVLCLCSLNISLPGHRGLLLLKLNVSKMELLEFPPTDLLLCQCSLSESTRLLRNLGATPHSPLIHSSCSIIHQLLFIMSPEWCPDPSLPPQACFGYVYTLFSNPLSLGFSLILGPFFSVSFPATPSTP